MGEISDLVLEGVLCQVCGVYIGDVVGFPQTCKSCIRQSTGKQSSKKKKTKKRKVVNVNP